MKSVLMKLLAIRIWNGNIEAFLKNIIFRSFKKF